MLTFLRKIRLHLINQATSDKVRKSLLASSSFKKYMLYALGEIALVVIGILIALQINNWNENQNQKSLEIKLLKEMKGNLESDLADLRYNVSEDSETLRSNEVILDYIVRGLPYHDSLSTHFGQLPRNSTLVENVSAYENLKTFGFGLIKNDSLRMMITDLYSERYAYVDEINVRTSNKFLWDHFNPILLKNLRSASVLVDAKPVDYNQLMNNTQFEETLRWHIAIKRFNLDLYKDTESKILNSIQAIDLELKNED